MNSNKNYWAADCPVCKKPDSARSGNSRWRHNYLCCSDECGVKLREKLDTLYSSKKWLKLNKELDKAQEKVNTLLDEVVYGSNIIHYGTFSGNFITLCGVDVSGEDDTHVWSRKIETINCPKCLELLDAN